MERKLIEAWMFFKKHAGYSDPPGKAACALALAKAERVASEREWMVVWEEDPNPYDGDSFESWKDAPKEVLVAVLKDDDGNVLEVLGGIADPSKEYGRVIEAELALEACARLSEFGRRAAGLEVG